MAEKPVHLEFHTRATTEYGWGHLVRVKTMAAALSGRLNAALSLTLEGDDAAREYAEPFFPAITFRNAAEKQAIDSRESDHAPGHHTLRHCSIFDMIDVPHDSIRRAQKTGALTVVFNDTGIDYPVGDIIVSPQELRRSAEPQASRKIQGQTILSGRDYFVIGENLKNFIHKTPASRTANRRVLVSLGGAVTRHTFDHIKPVLLALSANGVPVRFLLGLSNKIPEAGLKQLSGAGVELMPGTHNIAAAFEGVTMAVSASGYLKYELASAGIPALLVSIVDHQEELGRVFAERSGAADYMGRLGQVPTEEIVYKTLSLYRDSSHQETLAKNGLAFIDGNGADRITDTIIPRMPRLPI